jgi:hypothetical protein
MAENDSVNDINRFFYIYDTNDRNKSYFLNFDHAPGNTYNMVRGTGMCYLNNYWYGVCLAKEHRVGSKLIIRNINTGKARINDLKYSKAVHSITSYGKQGIYNLILANSTQNDSISIITTHETEVVTEDIYFDFLTNQERVNYNWNEEYLHDDSFHNNCVLSYNGDIYVSMFLDFQLDGAKKIRDANWRENGKVESGAIYNLKKLEKVYSNCKQPHSIMVDSRDNLLFCESSEFMIRDITNNKSAKLNGFTRGLCEDKEKGGYWVGLSYHRKFNTDIKGAGIHFVSYDMKLGEYVDLEKVGKEVYDIVPFIKGN